MSHDQRQVPYEGGKSAQTVNGIRHGGMDDGKQDSKLKKRAAVVADPKNRLVDGEIDPVTKELKPDRNSFRP